MVTDMKRWQVRLTPVEQPDGSILSDVVKINFPVRAA